ncbi:MAG: cupredoxin domain-containing protein [Dehalococcoidia bacterium]|nr:cupredoxin domain-containing protein [Dehalococcoidia bacterium]
MNHRLLCAPVLALGLLLTTACGEVSNASGGQEIIITAGERSGGRQFFEPQEVTVPAGARVSFVIKNVGSEDHEFESEEAHVEEVVVPPGRERRATWTAPTQPGRYPAYCDLPGHRAMGMEMTLIVK